ncbi:hypothetical protein ANAEL_02229 [Anaerolineales bacterium]|nr:hypothetical protein ANAEL_02229 [Anaerolineales bacterium]
MARDCLWHPCTKRKTIVSIPPAVISGDEALLLILKKKLASEMMPIDTPPKPRTPKPNPWRNFKHGKVLYERNNTPLLRLR